MNRAQWDSIHSLVSQYDPDEIERPRERSGLVFVDLVLPDGALVKATVRPDGGDVVMVIPAEATA